MTHKPQIIVITDPRTFDGTPYAVAERAMGQIIGLLGQTLDVMPETRKMVLNADLERQLAYGQEPNPHASVLTKKLLSIERQMADLRKQLEVIERAAVYDPKHPPRA